MIKSIISSIEETHLIKFDQYDLIEISGADALEFLNNQLTNDLKKLTKNSSSLGAWCSIKGRVLYTFRIWRKGDLFQILLPCSQTESFLKKLRMFVFRSDVSIEIAKDQFVYGLFGKEADQILSSQAIPQNENEVSVNDENILIKIPSQITRYLIISNKEKLEIDSLSVQSDQELLLNDWNLLNIDAGIAEILPETADMFLPQMLDLERLGALSFQKGCYPGQEIVARVKYRGEVKKQLYLASIETKGKIISGLALKLDDQLIGHIVSATSTKDNQWAALAVLNIKDIDSQNIKLQNDQDSSCTFFSR